ncbi:hypothetical protein FVER53590_01026 [Fusarium verticillioides]|nr:hypothetical protein FVER14953_01026 [Fusarium verticillioides]RBR06963.1 hypothetical protein FVER53590_01026 [Fusarium verticillioides]
MPRKLVTVRHVSAITAIPQADRIAAATVDGWTCFVPINVFKDGDLASTGHGPAICSLVPNIIGPGGPTSAPDIRVQTIQIRGGVVAEASIAFGRFS